MLVAQFWIDNVKRLLAAREPFLNKRKQHTILLLRAVKKRTDMAMFAERRIGKPHRLVVLFAKFSVVLGGIHRVFTFLVEDLYYKRLPQVRARRISPTRRSIANWKLPAPKPLNR